MRVYLKNLIHQLATSAELTVSQVNHNAVIKDLTGRVELSGGYLLMIILSCLVALLGLLTNSVAVVIGAMLISPLMGPIFTSALAFSLGDLHLAKQALKIIGASILLTVLVAAFFTLLSPLKTPTAEILSRTRPNIYDLLIAALAGTAGAFALCTWANYLFVTTGVAVATAVIPPLSVVGYGLGTGHIGIAMGGFLLFFTNLVAIVISSDLVFHIFKFRPSMVEGARYPARRRVQILGSILVLISVPLVYTLVIDINRAKIARQIERVLMKHLDRKDFSRLTEKSFQVRHDQLTVTASVNTVSYLDASVEKIIENDVSAALNRPVRLDLEQVLVKPGHVLPRMPSLLSPLVASPPPQRQTLDSLRQQVVGRIKEGLEELGVFVKPYSIKQCEIRFAEQQPSSTVVITVARDYPFTENERRWLNLTLEKKLGESLVLELETVPFLPPMMIGHDGKPDEASRKALTALNPVLGIDRDVRIVLTAPQSTGFSSIQKRNDLAALKDYLVGEFGIPSHAISRGPDHGSDFRVMVEPNPPTPSKIQ